jgi:ubiquinone/menaquinone biosynthesis C-methylase UbiE
MLPVEDRSAKGGTSPGIPHNESVGPDTLLRLAALTRGLKRRVTRLLAVANGNRVLDVGCGPGVDTVSMARFVGATGLVLGIDHSEEMIEVARARARKAGVSRWVIHHRADAMALPFRDGVFDACRSERLCQHVVAAPRVIAEMVRVVRYGGRVVVSDADWSTLSIDTSEVEIERRVVAFLSRAVANGQAGRQLFRLLQRELSQVTVEVWPIIWTDYETFRQTSLSLPRIQESLIDSGTIGAEELQRLMRSLQEAGARREFFATASMVLAAGVRERVPEIVRSAVPIE